MTPVLIRQKHRYGCGIACMAMVTGLSYDQVAIDFPNIEESRGITFHDVDYWLAEHGYAVSRKWAYKRGNQKADPWPPVPWTDMHIVQVEIVRGSHFVVMLRDETVFDPNAGEKTSLRNPYFVSVNQVAGIHKFGEVYP